MEYFSMDNPGQNCLLEERMVKGRQYHISVLMADGHVLTAGGSDDRFDGLSLTAV